MTQIAATNAAEPALSSQEISIVSTTIANPALSSQMAQIVTTNAAEPVHSQNFSTTATEPTQIAQNVSSTATETPLSTKVARIVSTTATPSSQATLIASATATESPQMVSHFTSSKSPAATTTEHVPWPRTGISPINEFVTEGYFSCAFPTLFPTGAGDFMAPRLHPVTVGNYFKHLLMYGNGQFAKHPRFRYFALNTEMRWRALQTGKIYVNQHPADARLTLDDLRDMVGRDREFLTSRVLHFASCLRGTSQYWYKQKNKLISMVETLGIPTVFFTHSAADSQWPELARLLDPDNPDSSSSRSRAVAENPAIADWFFYNRIAKFIDAYYIEVMGAKDFWYRFEWQHRGSPHVHGIAWLEGAPDVQKLLASIDDMELIQITEEVIAYADSIVSTMNPAISSDGSDVQNAPQPQTRPHVCNKPYSDIEDFSIDLVELIATCQRHTKCSTAYCLKKKKGKLECRFNYPKDLQPTTSIETKENVPTLLTQRNDSLLNSYNPVQLSAWRANVDFQFIVSWYRVFNYLSKYAAKPESRSTALKAVYKKIMKSLGDDVTPLKLVQKVMINSVGERDYSAQEVCHLLLQLPMYRASRDFVILSLDGSREIDDKIDEGNDIVTIQSLLDHYCSRPNNPHMNMLTLLEFARKYRISKKVSEGLICRRKEAVVIARPFCSSDPNGPQYEQYCKQKLMLHKPFHQIEELQGSYESYSEALSNFLQSGTVSPSLAEDIQRLENAERSENPHENEDCTEQQCNGQVIQDWMLLCQLNAEFETAWHEQDCDWLLAGRNYPELYDMPSFITQQRQSYHVLHSTSSCVNPDNLKGKQLQAYSIIHEHFKSDESNRTPLRMVVSGTAGTGKSYLIKCLKKLLKDQLCIAAPTGSASFNVNGETLHSLLALPVRGDFKPLEGKRLQTIQTAMAGITYIIIDEMSMMGRKLFGQVDRRLRQFFPHRSDELLGGLSCLLIGDWGQLPPVMDLPLYTTSPKSELSDLGSTAYHLFDCAIVLDQAMRQAGTEPGQEAFRNLLLRLRNAETTVDDWKILMKRTPAEIGDISAFDGALYLYPTIEAVAEHNITKLRANNKPIAMLKAVHTGPGAAKASSEDAGGLENVICLSHEARVMLKAICYDSGNSPPDLPVAVTVKFDNYTGPTLSDGTVPIIPLRRTWFSTTNQCSRLQIPLKLAWAITVHKSQGLTLDKAIIDIGRKEFSTGLTFVACSRVRRLTDLLFVPPFTFQRLVNLKNSSRLKERLLEDARLKHIDCCDGHAQTATTPIDDDVVTLPSVPYSCPFKYHPVNDEWQRQTCANLGLPYLFPNGVTPGGLHVPLTPPASIKPIIGDGNCLFRSIAHIITGSQEQHMSIRQAIVNHSRVISHLLQEYSGDTESTMNEYLNSSEMELSGVWGTDLEMMSLAHLLGICVYYYITEVETWHCLNPCSIDNMITESNLCNMGIYLHHPTSHFEVVTSVLLPTS